MNNIVKDDGWVHSLAQPCLLLSPTCDEILSWMLEIWMKNHLVSDYIIVTIMPLLTWLYQIITKVFPKKLDTTPSVIVEASAYPNLTTRTCYGGFQVGLVKSLLHMFIVLSTNQWMLHNFCLIPKCLTTHLSYHHFLLLEAHAVIAKIKSNQSQGWEVTLLKVLHSCLMSNMNQREGRRFRLQISTFEPCHIICQLGSALHILMVWRPYF